MMLVLTSLRLAVRSLEFSVKEATSSDFMDHLTPRQRDVVRAGVIQAFELTYELCWKFMKRWLAQNLGPTQVDGIPRRELFRLAAEHRLVEDSAAWFRHHEARNLTAHTYDASTAAEVFDAARGFLHGALAFLAALEQRND